MVRENSKLLCLAALLAAFSVSAGAQTLSSSLGSERGTLGWRTIETKDYQILYPSRLDSLGKVYAGLLQQYHPIVGLSTGYAPNQVYGGKMPIILHPLTAESNGAVAMAPRRMDLITSPDPFGRIAPLPWETLLAIHENRHVSQIQLGHSGFWTGFQYVFGDIMTSLLNTLADQSYLEGDAVVMETALTRSGRGRTADFLSYFRMSFDQGDWRTWDRWRYGSSKYYTPDYYKVGYMTIAGFRYVYNEPLFISKLFNRLSHPWVLFAGPDLTHRVTGKRFKDAWAEIAGTFQDLWAADDSLRAPFQNLVAATDIPTVFTGYSGAVEVGEERVWALRTAMDRTTELVEILPYGEIKTIRPFAGSTSKLAASPERSVVYWSENVRSPRWEFEGESRIYKMRTTPGASPVALTSGSRYFHPAVSADEDQLAVVEYLPEGGSAVVLLDASSGREKARLTAPAGVQFTEPAFWGEDVIVAGISENGSALYRTDFRQLNTVVLPSFVKIKDLRSYPDGLYFTSDRTGTNEIYLLNPDDGSIKRLTNTHYGVSQPFQVSGSLAFTALTKEGNLLSRADERFAEEVDFSVHAAYPVADCLSAQEDSLRARVQPVPVEMSSPAPYKKLGHAFHFHSWFPVYVNLDGFSATESSYLYETASVGAMGFFQNLTGTFSGSVGMGLHRDPFSQERLLPGLHSRLHYNGLYPVIDVALDAGDRAPAILTYDEEEGAIVPFVQPDAKNAFYVGGGVTVSLPLNFSSNGWQRKITPAITLGGSTDFNEWSDDFSLRYFRRLYVQTSLKGEFNLPTAISQLMPRWGIGALAKARMGTDASVLYGQGWLYLPGITRTQGLKLTGTMQLRWLKVPGVVYPFDFGAEDIAPRGYVRSSVPNLLNQMSYIAARASVDYAIPLWRMDASIGDLFYLRDLELVPFADATAFLSRKSLGMRRLRQILFSAGTDISIRFEKLIIVSMPIKLGVRVAYNGGLCYDYFKEAAGLKSPIYVGFLFDIDL